MSTPMSISGSPSSEYVETKTFLGHPSGLFLLFLVEMWERFSYYGMRALLVLYLTTPETGMRVLPSGRAPGFNPGRAWGDGEASVLYGWYTGLAYLMPIVGGMIADKIIGTHRSMVVGGLIIALGHIVLAVSGMGAMEHSQFGMSVFMFGLALIVIGTGHFKPSVSVMVGQLYKPGDPRRDGAFSIFYMGINLGAFLCAYVCGSLGELVGWHWGFGSAAVGMLLGLGFYCVCRPMYLNGIGLPPAGKGASAPLFILVAAGVSAAFAAIYHAGGLAKLGEGMDWLKATEVMTLGSLHVSAAALVAVLMFVLTLFFVGWFVAIQESNDRGPTASIFIFMFFNAFFWIAFEQAGSSINLFTDRFTDRSITIPPSIVSFASSPSIAIGSGISVLGLVIAVLSYIAVLSMNRQRAYGKAVGALIATLIGCTVLAIGVLKATDNLRWLAELKDVPTTWFQSVNAGLIFMLAPVFAAVWTGLGRRKMNPSQPVKIALGLLFLGAGYWFMVRAGVIAKDGAGKASMMLILATYFWHTVGELCLSPTGLSYVTKAAPKRFVSLLMGIWFISSFIANLGGGLIAAKVEDIEKGVIKLPWNYGGQADYFFLFVVSSCGAGLIVLLLTPLLKMLIQGREDDLPDVASEERGKE